MTQAKLKFDAPLTARRALRAPRKDVASPSAGTTRSCRS